MTTYNPYVTIFKTMYEKSGYAPPVSDVLERIRTGKNGRGEQLNTKAIVDTIRGSVDEVEIKKLKNSLPAIRFSGKFTGQEDMNCVEHSGLICLDFDKVPDVVEVKQYFALQPFTYAAFISPSGNGVKVLIRIPADIKTHRGFFMGLQKYYFTYNKWFDKSSINLSRICFESYDPEIYINTNALEFENFSYEVEQDSELKASIPVKQIVTDQSELQKVINIIRRAQVGQRHAELLKAAKLLGGYIGSGVIHENDVYKVEQVVKEIFSSEGEAEVKTQLKGLHDGIKYGKSMPVYTQTDETPKDITNNSIIYLNQVWNKMEDEYDNGKKHGESTLFPEIDRCFTWRKGEVTLFSGIGGSGKSTILHQLLLMQAAINGKKSVLFSPESHPAEDFYDEFIEPYVGKTSDKRFPNRMSKEEKTRAGQFISDKIFYVHPRTAHTITEIEANFRYAIQTHGAEFCVLDPYNQIAHQRPAHFREDEYLSEWLTARARFAEEHNVNYVIVAHPNASLRPEKGGDGEYPVMHYIHLAGGMMWSNKVFNFIVTHRPHYRSNPQDPSVEFHSIKIKKHKLVGIPGIVPLTYDRDTFRFYDKNNFNPLGNKFSHSPQPQIYLPYNDDIYRGDEPPF